MVRSKALCSARGSTYRPSRKDVGFSLSVLETATNTDGRAAATSNRSGRVRPGRR
jgi:hypothetical protein